VPFADFADANPNYITNLWKPFNNKGYVTKLCRHHLAQVGKNRRILSIPNPINQLRLVQAMEQHFKLIFSAAGVSPISASKPHLTYTQARAIWPLRNFQTIPAEKAKARAVARYIVTTDVARFFSSIYTHSIPWALHGKSASKANRGPGLVGNILDKILREMQDGQTMGIPIGPDTSHVIAEIILSSVDERACGDCKGFRWFDDYEISGLTKGACETALVRLERALFEYELEINAGKTMIRELPLPIEDDWVPILRDFKFRAGRDPQWKDLNSFFSAAFHHAARHSGKTVLRYAVRKLHGAKLHVSNWRHAQRLMAQAATHEPEVLPHVLGCLNYYERIGYTIDRELLSKLLETISIKYSERYVASEVAWAVWGFLQFGMVIPTHCVERALLLADDVVSLLLLDARRRGLIEKQRLLSSLGACIDARAFNNDHWLLAYEGVRKGWLRPPIAHCVSFKANPHVTALLESKVFFYDDKWLPDASARHIFGTPSWLLYQLPEVDEGLVEDVLQP
jgi:hypothetical protein